MTNDLDAPNGTDATRHQRFAAALVAVVVGQLVGNNSATLAKLYVFLRDQPYSGERIAEVSVQILAILALLGIVFGGLAARRGWASFEQVVTSTVIATVAAAFTILDQSLPVPSGHARLPFGETFYYLGWVAGLFFLPLLLMPPPPDGEFAGWMRRKGGLVVVAAAMGLVGFASGAILERGARPILDAYGWLDGGSYLDDSQRFWMARPSTVNAICSMYVVVAFSGIWWRGLWRSAIHARLWAAGISVFAAVYAGIYGWFLYAPGRGGEPWQFSVAFGVVPVVTAGVVVAAFRMARRHSGSPAVGWPVSDLFWWLLPLGFSVGFALCAGFGFAPLALQGGATGEQLAVLVSAHAINGLVFGLILRAMTYSVKFMPDVPDVQRGSLRDG